MRLAAPGMRPVAPSGVAPKHGSRWPRPGKRAAPPSKRRHSLKNSAGRRRRRRAQRRLRYDADMSLASQAWDNANIRQLEELLENHWPRPGEEDLRGFEWY